MTPLRTLVSAAKSSKDCGRFFETFSSVYLLHSGLVRHVVPVQTLSARERGNLLLPSRDVGIDLVGWKEDDVRPVAVQCKFRSKVTSPLPWRSVATFDALVARTGPWGGKILVTTAPTVSFHGLSLKEERFVTGSDLDAESMDAMLAMCRIADRICRS